MKWKLPALLLCASLVGTAPVVAQAQETRQEAELNAVEGLVVQEREDGTYIRIRGSEVATFSVFKLDDPPRLFVDLSNSRVAAEGLAEEIYNGVITRVGLVEFEDGFQTVARLVIGFNESAHYDVRTEGSDVVVFVDGEGRREAAPLQVERNNDELRQREAELAEARQRLASTEEQFRQEAAQRQRESAERRREYESAVGQLDRTREDLDRARQELAQLRSQRDSAQGEERRQVEAAIERQNRSLSEMQAQIESREQLVAQMRSAVAELEAERDQERQRVQEARTRAERAEAARQDALRLAQEREEERELARSRAAELERQLQATSQNLESLSAEKTAAQNRISVMGQEVQQAESRIAEQRRQLEEAQQRTADLERRLQQARASAAEGQGNQAAVRELEAQRQELRNQERQRTAQLERAQQEARRAEQELTSLQSSLTQRDRELAELRRSLEESQQARAEMESAQSRANREARQARDEVASREAELRELANQVQAQRAELEDLRTTRSQEMRRAQEAQRALEAQRTEETRQGQAAQAVAVDPLNSNAIRGVRLETTSQGRSRIIVDLERPGQFETATDNGRSVMIFNNVTLPDHLEKTLSADGEGGAVRFLSSYTLENGRVRMEADLGQDASEVIRQEGNSVVWEFAPTVAPSSDRLAGDTRPRRLTDGDSVTSAPPNYPRVVTDPTQVNTVPGMGRNRLTIDLRNVDIENLLRLIASESGVNIIAGSDVSGSVTMRLRSVPLDQAFLTILQSLQLGFEIRGNVIRVAPQSTLIAEQNARSEARARAQAVEPLEVFLLPINYASASDLTTQVQGLLSPRGSVSVDQRTNTLIIKDLRDNLSSIRILVETLDAQVPQVLIEARIVETNDNFTRQIGIQWGGDLSFAQGRGNPTGLIFPNVLGLAGGATDGQTPTAGGSENPNFAVNLPAAAGTGSGGALGLTMGSIGGAVNLNLRLSALEDAGHAKIISSPRILTLDNQQASISQGTSIPISVVGAAGVQTVFVDATLELIVTPHVTPDGNVRLSIQATKNEPDFQNTGARGDPTIIQNQAQTELLIKDGDTTVIGGIYSQNTGYSVSAVPFLHRIPVLGFFFRTRSETENRQELLIFITPRIVNRAEALGVMSAGTLESGGFQSAD